MTPAEHFSTSIAELERIVMGFAESLTPAGEAALLAELIENPVATVERFAETSDAAKQWLAACAAVALANSLWWKLPAENST